MLLLLLFALCLAVDVRCDEQLTDRLRNTPPELSTSTTGDDELRAAAVAADDIQVEERFFPFSASLSLNPSDDQSHTFSINGNPDGIDFSHKSRHDHGRGPGSYSVSHSQSISAGYDGIAGSKSSAINHNHPVYGPQAEATGNSFVIGQGEASSHGDVINGQAISDAQSSVGGAHSQASSGTSQNLVHHHHDQRPGRPAWNNNVPPNYNNGYDVPPNYDNGYYAPPNYANGYEGNYYNQDALRPSLTISVNDDSQRYNPQPTNGWYETTDSWNKAQYCRYYYRDPRCRRPGVTINRPGDYYGPYYENRDPYYQNIRDIRQPSPNLQVSNVHAESSAQSGPGGHAIGESISQGGYGPNGPTSSTLNHVESSGNANSNAHGTSGLINYHPGKLEASLSSGSISANSGPGGYSQGTSHGTSSGNKSHNNVQSLSFGSGSTHGTAQSGNIVFPE